MSLIINSEVSKQYLLEEDAIAGFKKAVNNNQLQLAMRVLVDILDVFVEGFDILIDAEEVSSIEPEEKIVEVVAAPELATEDKKNVNKKTEAKTEEK
jgi:hypothetical protein